MVRAARKASASAIDVARCIVNIGQRRGCPVDPLKLQKLLYMVQGWALVEWDQPMFQEKMEAWPWGPVVPEVYRAFVGYKSRSIRPDGALPCELVDQERALIEAVFERYCRETGLTLSAISHEEEPWKQAREDLAPNEPSSNEVDLHLVGRTFRDQYIRAQEEFVANWGAIIDAATHNTRTISGRDAI